MPEAVLDLPPIASSVGVLDDEVAQLEQLSVVCKTFGACEMATDYRDFMQLLNTHEFDAVSIDWELRNGVERGADLLRHLRRHHPEIASVVFTKHQRRIGDALREGADFCLVKPIDDDLSAYRERMLDAARIGLNRRIAARLRALGYEGVPAVNHGESVSRHVEEGLYRMVQGALSEVADDQRDAALLGLSIRRGWWELARFSIASFAKLTRGAKLRLLSLHAGLLPSDLAGILEIESQTVSSVLDREDHEITDVALVNTMDRLLSVLAYVLRLAAYQLPFMAHFALVSGHFAGAGSPPPWDSEGLVAFLKRTQRVGVNDALIWIRGH